MVKDYNGSSYCRFLFGRLKIWVIVLWIFFEWVRFARTKGYGCGVVGKVKGL